MLPGFCWSKTSELNKDIMRLTIPTSFRFLTVMIKSAVPSRIGRNYPFCFSMLASEASTCLLLLPYVLSHTSKNQIARSAAAAAAAKSLQLCPTLCDPIDGSPPGSPIPGILQERTLEWVAISFFNAWKWKVKVKSLSRVWPSATPWTAAFQAPPSMGFPGKLGGYLEWDISLPSFKISYIYSKIFLELCKAICVRLDRWQ